MWDYTVREGGSKSCLDVLVMEMETHVELICGSRGCMHHLLWHAHARSSNRTMALVPLCT